ncbi:MAG: ThuA domain-containing protein [Muribaculaceae bacterium]|nr:ThuA domain-containing protein [Muribaculaceae bacterium]
MRINITRFAALMLASLLWVATFAKNDDKVVVAYVTSWSHEMPDPQFMTHINYAFGGVGETFDRVTIDNPERLASIVALKKNNPGLKVLLSIGGWGSGRFSEMAADPRFRKSFAKDCDRVVKQYGLDGIDIDWEYPTSNAADISASPDDTKNFTLLMKDIRKAIGKKKLLTLATVCSAEYIDFPAIMPYVDLVNVMSYDMGGGERHHAGLHKSENTGHYTSDHAVEAHLKAGVPAEKLVMGMPFYGRGTIRRGGDYGSMQMPEGSTEIWDNTAKVPFILDKDDKIIFGFDNPRSLNLKCQYINDNGLRGAMYWDYAGDDNKNSLRSTVANKILYFDDMPNVLVLNEGGGQHGPFTRAAMNWLMEQARDKHFTVTELQNANAVNSEVLKDVDLIIQLDFPPYTWPKEAADAFTDYIDNGKGAWIGFHHATLLGEFDGYPMWKWFSDFMGGVTFNNYVAALADAIVDSEDTTHPVMQGVYKRFILNDDEWYTYDKSPRPNVRVLASVDEQSYTPDSPVKMGDHPVVWTNESKKAKNVYFQFGHSPRLFNSASFVKLFSNAIDWSLAK